MNFINSPIGDSADEEESTFLSDLVIAILAFEWCLFLGFYLAHKFG